MESNLNPNIILEAVSGSHAYGLDTPESDIDLKGVFVAPTLEVLSLRKPRETIDRTDPDDCYHEVEKFIRLAMKCNPTILEMLFLDDYRILTETGKLLISARNQFLSNTVYKSYGGYAIAQARKLNRRGDSWDVGMKNRYAKHARHCFRLLEQGRQLLETGDMDVKVKNREELFSLGELNPEQMVDKFEKSFKEFDKIKSILPDEPDYDAINEILLTIRKHYYDS
jgi:hypothetical protein